MEIKEEDKKKICDLYFDKVRSMEQIYKHFKGTITEPEINKIIKDKYKEYDNDKSLYEKEYGYIK